MLHERHNNPDGYRVFEHSPRFRRLAEAADKPGGFGRAPLTALSWLYSAGLAAFLATYRIGLRKQKRIATPVVSVGNLTLGGTGKTPIVRWLCESFLQEGVKPCVVSYGYGGSACGSPTVVSDGKSVYLGADEAGDEPTMLARLLPGIPVVIGKRRYDAAQLAEEKYSPTLIVLDDGFQHWQLHRNLDIVVIDARRPFGNRRTIPAGPLREPVSAIKRAGLVVLTHSSEITDDVLRELENEVRKIAPEVEVYRARNADSAMREMTTGERISSRPHDERVCAVSSIGEPWGFERSVVKTGLPIACAVRYPDHHRYSSSDTDDITRVARDCGASAIVTTEKDAVRWHDAADGLPVVVLDTRVEIEGGEAILAGIRKLLVDNGT